MKYLSLSILFVPLVSMAVDKSDEFNALEQSAYQKPLTAIEVLLRPYGKMEEFKVFDGSVTTEVCRNKSIIRAITKCGRMESVKESIFYAEGNGLLCKITNNLQNIRCLPK